MTPALRQIALAALLALAAPVLRAAEVSVRTSRVVDDCDSVWMVEVNTPGEVESSVCDADGRRIAGPFAAKLFSVADVKPWTAERPVCYTLVTDGDDGRTETVFGFTEQVLRERRLFVNGTPVRLKLGPRDWNGNTVSSETCTAAEAWTNGLYRIAPEHLAQLDVLRPRSIPGATRHFFQDWSVRATNYCERILVSNRSSFLTGNDVTLRWALLVDGEERDDGTIDLLGLKPGQQAAFDMPPAVISARYRDGTVGVRFAFVRDGETVAEDQVDLVVSRSLNSLDGTASRWFGLVTPTVSFSEVAGETGGTIRRFTTDDAIVTFAEEDIGGVVYTRRGLFSDTRLVTRILPWRRLPVADGAGDIAYPQSPVSEHRGALSFTGLAEAGGVMASQRWTVWPDGTVCCRARLRTVSAIRGERLGFTLSLARPVERLEWFGRGPWSHGRHEQGGAFLGRWTADVGDSFAAEDVRGLRLGSLTVRTAGAPLAVRLGNPGYLSLYGEPDADGVVDIAFTLSVDDSDLTARTPDGEADLPAFPTIDITPKESETK